jgi:hypothetical protein
MGSSQSSAGGSALRLYSASSFRRVRRFTAGVVLLLQFGCYTYVPARSQPEPGSRVTLQISDQGRVALGERVGSGVTRIEGILVGSQDGDYVMRVYEVGSLNGNSHWAGERVDVRQEHVVGIQERHFSKSRTALAVGASVAGVLIFAITRGLLTRGGSSIDPGGGPPDGS